MEALLRLAIQLLLGCGEVRVAKWQGLHAPINKSKKGNDQSLFGTHQAAYLGLGKLSNRPTGSRK